MRSGVRSPARRLAPLPVLLLALGVQAAGPVIDLARFDEPANSDKMIRAAARLSGEIGSHPAAALYAQRGAVWFKLREFDKAIEDFTAALKLDDKLDEAYFGRGMAFGRNGQTEEAVTDLGVYIHRHPDSSLAYTKRGIRYLWGGDLDRAAKDFSRAIELDPRNAEAHDDLGVIHAQRGDYEVALRHFQTTVRVDPSYQKGWHNLAMVYYITSRNDQALKAVERALTLIPEARDAMLLKANVLDALGRSREAKALREEAEFLPAGERSARMPIQ